MKNLFNHTNDKVVNEIYENNLNYKIIENSDKNAKSTTVIYFSSNGLYFPNTYDRFKEIIIDNDKYEWSKPINQIKNVKKTILVRDIYKQWYLKGINKDINNIDKLVDFIKNEHKDEKLILIGTSSGGYIATLIGSILNADIIFNFAGQLTLEKIFDEGSDPIVQNSYVTWGKYYNLNKFIENSKSNIFYFVCKDSLVDQIHIEIANNSRNIKMFLFNCNVHGIPFKNILLKYLLGTDCIKLNELSMKYSNKSIEPSLFWKFFIHPIRYYMNIILYMLQNIDKVPKKILNKIKNKYEK